MDSSSLQADSQPDLVWVSATTLSLHWWSELSQSLCHDDSAIHRWQWCNFFISAVFRHFVGQALRNVCYSVCYSDVSRRHFLNKIAIVWTFFLNQLIQFYSNNATDLHHLTTHSTTCWPTKWQSHCDHRYVTSLHPMYKELFYYWLLLLTWSLCIKQGWSQWVVGVSSFEFPTALQHRWLVDWKCIWPISKLCLLFPEFLIWITCRK